MPSLHKLTVYIGTLYHIQAIRDEMLRTTAPPSEQYNDPSLRNRSEAILSLIAREDKNSEKIFTRRDMINHDWTSQDKMNKLANLRNAPPTYSPPKPPPFIQTEEHRHNFHADTRKNSRGRFNSFTSDNLQKLGVTKKKKKKTKDLFRMKVFTKKDKSKEKSMSNANLYDSNSEPQPITKMLKLQNTMSGPVTITNPAPSSPVAGTEGMHSYLLININLKITESMCT